MSLNEWQQTLEGAASTVKTNYKSYEENRERDNRTSSHVNYNRGRGRSVNKDEYRKNQDDKIHNVLDHHDKERRDKDIFVKRIWTGQDEMDFNSSQVNYNRGRGRSVNKDEYRKNQDDKIHNVLDHHDKERRDKDIFVKRIWTGQDEMDFNSSHVNYNRGRGRSVNKDEYRKNQNDKIHNVLDHHDKERRDKDIFVKRIWTGQDEMDFNSSHVNYNRGRGRSVNKDEYRKNQDDKIHNVLDHHDKERRDKDIFVKRIWTGQDEMYFNSSHVNYNRGRGRSVNKDEYRKNQDDKIHNVLDHHDKERRDKDIFVKRIWTGQDEMDFNSSHVNYNRGRGRSVNKDEYGKNQDDKIHNVLDHHDKERRDKDIFVKRIWTGQDEMDFNSSHVNYNRGRGRSVNKDEYRKNQDDKIHNVLDHHDKERRDKDIFVKRIWTGQDEMDFNSSHVNYNRGRGRSVNKDEYRKNQDDKIHNVLDHHDKERRDKDIFVKRIWTGQDEMDFNSSHVNYNRGRGRSVNKDEYGKNQDDKIHNVLDHHDKERRDKDIFVKRIWTGQDEMDFNSSHVNYNRGRGRSVNKDEYRKNQDDKIHNVLDHHDKERRDKDIFVKRIWTGQDEMDREGFAKGRWRGHDEMDRERFPKGRWRRHDEMDRGRFARGRYRGHDERERGRTSWQANSGENNMNNNCSQFYEKTQHSKESVQCEANSDSPVATSTASSVTIKPLQITIGDRKTVKVVYDSLEFNTLLETIAEEATSTGAINALTLKKGSVCIARYGEDDAWYRAVVQSVSALVSFCDYGNKANVPLTDIKEIKSDHIHLPAQGIPCSLLAAKPQDECWSTSENDLFESLTDEKTLEAMFVSQNDGRYDVILKDGECIINLQFGATAEQLEALTAIKSSQPAQIEQNVSNLPFPPNAVKGVLDTHHFEEIVPPKEKKFYVGEDRRNPQHIPKRGHFYKHDDRTAVQEVGQSETSEKETAERAAKEGTVNERTKKLGREHEKRWSHDLYNEEEQAPKSIDELISIYGYNIRNEERPSPAARRQRYGYRSSRHRRSN